MYHFYSQFGPAWGMGAMQYGAGAVGFFSLALIIFLAWSLGWKAWAMWLAARRKSPIWFIVLLLVNTGGILDIIYIFFIAKRSDKPDNKPSVDK